MRAARRRLIMAVAIFMAVAAAAVIGVLAIAGWGGAIGVHERVGYCEDCGVVRRERVVAMRGSVIYSIDITASCQEAVARWNRGLAACSTPAHRFAWHDHRESGQDDIGAVMEAAKHQKAKRQSQFNFKGEPLNEAERRGRRIGEEIVKRRANNARPQAPIDGADDAPSVPLKP